MSRRITFRSLMLSLLTLLALGAGSRAVAQTPVRIMPLGDSITAAPGCWRAYLWTRLQSAGFNNIDFVGTSPDRSGCGFTFDMEHEGHSGFSITSIADQNLLPAWLSATSPNIVIVHLGTNDMWGGGILLQTKLTAYTKLIGQMRAQNANMKIIVAQIIPMDPPTCGNCNADVIAFNNALPGWAAGLTTSQSPITLVDQFTGFDVGADSFDRVHPVTSGFIKMSDRFFPAVTAALNGTPPGPALAVTRAGTGTGTVTSNPAGINCGSTCNASFTNGTSVTLIAAAAGGSAFAGWSGACSGTGGCTVSMTQARSVTAAFNLITPTTFSLAVTRAGTGTGTVTSNPAGINCGTSCTANYNTGTAVTLTATASTGSLFGGWSGACTGTGTCTVSMTQSRNVTGTFQTQANEVALTVTRAGAGTGVVTSVPAGINCGTSCSATFGSNAAVTLSATPASGSTFAGWSGACTGTGNCLVTMSQARAVTATFNGGGTGGTCPNPITFSGNSGNFNTTSAVCYRTNTNIAGWGCFNFDGRTLTVAGVVRTCGQMPLTRAPDGYFYFAASAGQFPWAGLFTW
ncbi:MAG TPA: GDSL-type esterase/lipase family protein [Steroidobacteraceae bacterium]|nr:GDSL-type esterase/lipase family protein [Steroidobacteraceae bacterium]